jgi:ABC-type uncharacterized transport system permease subunit
MLIVMLSREQALRELLIQWTYVAAIAAINAVAWRVALRRYAAFGG